MRQSNGRIYKNSTREAHGKVEAILELRAVYKVGSSVQPVTPPAAEKDRLETFATQRKPLPRYPPSRMLHVRLVFVYARVFTITADSNARRYRDSAFDVTIT